jgi:serine phosphatase RsbU (regulator of sigma subunit)
VAALIRGVARHDPAAKILLVPALTVQTFQVAYRISRASYQLGWQGTPSELNFPLIREPFPIGLQNCVDVAFVLGVGAFLIRRYTQSRSREERYGAEMAAAQQVQLRLVPSDLPHVAGFQLEASYFSASEVGGDFYHVVPGGDGSLLVVVGDVSGKGLRAAMTGTLAIGALRSLSQRDTGPAEILVRLNQQLVGAHDGGFVTCLCARITPTGEMTIANAGHLSPYLDGVEVPIMSGLPLGLTEEADYEELSVQAPSGSRLTFISDGVVEATNPAGELLGFERTQQLSRLSAAAIAQAAQDFGQEDDITVLTIQRTADVTTVTLS